MALRRGPRARTAVAVAVVALASSQAVVANVASTGSAAVAGVTRYFAAHLYFSGADGNQWQLAALASASDVATADVHTLYLALGTCTNYLPTSCVSAGRWKVPVPANRVTIAADLSTAQVTATVGGTPIAISLRATAATPVTPVPGPRYGAQASPSPDIAAGAGQSTTAAGTFSVGGRRCANHTDGRIGTFTGAESGSDPTPQLEWETSSDSFATSVPTGFARGFTHGGSAPFACLAPYEIPYGGQRVVVGAGTYSGRVYVPAGGSVDVNRSLLGIANGDRGSSYAMLMLKRVGEPGLRMSLDNQWVPPLPFTLPGSWIKGSPVRGSPPQLEPGTYAFVIASDHGAEMRFAGTRNVRVTVHRDGHVRLLRKQVGSTGPTTMLGTAQKIELPLTVTPSTYAATLGTEIVPDHLLLPADTVDITVCFRPASGRCTGDEWQSEGLNYGNDGFPAEVVPMSAAIHAWPNSVFPFPNGPAFASLTYKGTDTGDPLDLICLSAVMP